MLILRGLILVVAGFAFIFLPGVVFAAGTRRDLRYEPRLLLWGMGLLVVTLFPALYLTSLLRLIVWGGASPEGPMQYAVVVMGSLIAALFLEGGTYLLLRWRHIAPDRLLGSGMMVGLGVGLVTNIFQGMALVGSGFRLVVGDISTADLEAIAAQPWLHLLTGLLALNVYRIGQGVVAWLSLRWLAGQTDPPPPEPEKKKKRRAAASEVS